MVNPMLIDVPDRTYIEPTMFTVPEAGRCCAECTSTAGGGKSEMGGGRWEVGAHPINCTYPTRQRQVVMASISGPRCRCLGGSLSNSVRRVSPPLN